jgi:peptidoglycan/xylan/chitin deacetylase (PgdA/CDA1 family)
MRKKFSFLVALLILTAVFGLSMCPNTAILVNAEAAGQAAENEIPLPIVMYHKISKSLKSKYSVTTAQLESDFRAILAAGFTPVFMSEVINWVNGSGELPAKPIVITFDDGYYNNLCYGLPIARDLGVKFMISPVTGYSQYNIETGDTGKPSYSHLSWDEIREAHASGLVEFGNHTHQMHNLRPRYGIARKRSESHDEYQTALRDDVTEAQRLLVQSGVPAATTFAYPFGKYSVEGREILAALGFRAFLTCNEHVSKVVKGQPESLLQLGRFNRSGGINTEELLQKINGQPKRFI